MFDYSIMKERLCYIELLQTEDLFMIELRGVTKIYGGKVKALDDVSLSIDDGCIYGFLGPNGAGKTTAIKLMTGIIKPDSGSILVNGLAAMSIESKRNIGFVADDPNVFLRLKGIEYLSFMADMYDVGSAGRAQRIEELGARFEMSKALSDKIQSYSHGMRQKIVIMGALLHQPKVWILDEPMTGLDPKSSFELKKIIGLVLGFTGVVLVNFSLLDSALFSFSLTGEGFIAISSLFSAATAILIRKNAGKVDAVKLNGWQLLLGGLLLMTVGLTGYPHFPAFNLVSGLLLLYLAAISAVAFTIWFVLLKHHNVSYLSQFKFAIPVFGSLLSVIFIPEEYLGLEILAAILLVALGTLIVNRRSKTNVELE